MILSSSPILLTVFLFIPVHSLLLSIHPFLYSSSLSAFLLCVKIKIMAKKIFIITILIAGSYFSKAQLKSIFNKVKNKTEQRVDKKIDTEIDKSLDKAEGKNTEPALSEAPVDKQSSEAKPEEDNSIKSFSKFDFIPGDSILYAEDFQQDAMGELPVSWNTSGSGEVRGPHQQVHSGSGGL